VRKIYIYEHILYIIIYLAVSCIGGMDFLCAFDRLWFRHRWMVFYKPSLGAFLVLLRVWMRVFI